MKPCIILALLLPVATVAVAQQPPLSMEVKKKLAEASRSYTSPQTMDNLVAKVLPLQDTGRVELYRKLQQGGLVKATYSHTTPKGKVYTLTPDNMPCLVPDTKAVAAMPNARGGVPNDRMNAWPKQRIIPQEEEKREAGRNRK